MRARSRTPRAPLVAVAALGIGAVIAGCASPADRGGSAGDGAASPLGATVLGDEQTRPLADALPEAPGTEVSLDRLAEGLMPPTNSWFSGLVFGSEPQPVFPLPLSFGLVADGVAFGVPEVTSRPGAISAPHAPAVTLTAGTDSAVVTRYDEVSVTLALAAADEPTAEVTIARGSPVVSYTATAAHQLRLNAPVEAAPDAGEGVHTLQTPTATFALVAPEASVSDDGLVVELPEGATANWVAVPEGADVAELAALAASPITRVEVSASLAEDAATTALTYATADGSDTVTGRLPHQSEGASCALGSFLTAYGAMELCASAELEWSVPQLAPAGALALDDAQPTGDDRAELVAALEQDVAETPESPADTYFGGKALARLATMLQLARQLSTGDDATAEAAAGIATGLEERLTAELRTWTEPQGCEERAERCFTYDSRLRGIVGQEASFGSEEFNDHHFHYGYFLYAAGVLAGATGPAGAGGSGSAEIDTELVDELRPVMDLLAADIASSGGEVFPAQRAFDPYSGHSWASGFSPFADGNNQESSSEAVSAANGLALWAEATGDDALADQAQWMLSAEAHSARAYWTAFDRAAEPYAGYERGTVGIVWDAKRDFGTWFSPEPSAIVGIQLLPMHPMAGYLADGVDAERILDNIAEAAPGGAETATLFADSLLMYQSLAGPEQAEAALAAARELPASKIDQGGSRAYTLAFIMSQQ
ncbi:glycosyl hydrolase [Yonghaparkia sp. Root332]|uniref:glycosyl hydrolase n=1 Tax=Yonghaparkia sp. Root332 TaxID=1736516 RepID=UPI000A673EF9|nr:glycosyl hydrolase [Yonghaparkia sp. Root332]